MNKEDVVKLMVKSMNQDNLEMCERASMDRNQIDKMIEESQPSLQFMMSNMYDRMKEAGVLNS